jgi:hypothetical protein
MAKKDIRKITMPSGLVYRYLVGPETIKIWDPYKRVHLFTKESNAAVGPGYVSQLIQANLETT